MEYLAALGLLLMAAGGYCKTPGIAREYCDTEIFRPKCEEGEVIMMTSAKYGRMKLARCVTIDLGYLGCQSDVLHLADRECSGRRTCEIRVPNPEMENTRPCLKELKTYLEANYTCIPIYHPGNSCLETGANLTGNQGWLPSSVTMETGCGSKDLPWMITVDPGQRINVTLMDFSVEKTYHVKRLNEIDSFDIEATVCREYAVIHEVESAWKTMVCGGSHRWQHVYLSKTNTLRIEITNTGKRYFILKYEAVGCPDVPAPVNGWFKRTDSGASIGCTHTGEEWELRCSGSSWIGHMGNCSGAAHPGFMDNQHGYGISLPLGASIAIIIGAAIGVGLVVVIIGLIRFRRLFGSAIIQQRNRAYETPTREAIVLQEKSPVPPPDLQQTDLQQQPLPPIPLPAGDSGHCSMDTDPTAAGTPSSTPSSSYPVMTHSLQRTVRINGNEYAHIWETPLPSPKGTAKGPMRQISHPPPGPMQPTCRLEITRDPSGKNTFYTCTRYSPGLRHPGPGSPQFDGYHHHHHHMCPEANRSLSRPTPSTSTAGAPPHSPRGGTSTFCSPNVTPTRTMGHAMGGCIYGPSPHRHTQEVGFSSNGPGPSGGVTCGVVRDIPADFSDGGPRYSTLERKPGYGNNNSSSSSV